jgi:thymidylate kinase
MSSRPARGISIAVVGQDGAGKSTLVVGLARTLANEKLPAKQIYMGSGSGYSSSLKSLLNKAEGWVTKYPQAAIIRDFLLLAFHVQVARSYAIRSRKAAIAVNLGQIVIFDRYPQLQFPGVYDGLKITSGKHCWSLLARLLRPLCAKIETAFLRRAVQNAPDLVIKLILPVNISLERKPDHDIEKITMKNLITNELRFDNSKVSGIPLFPLRGA